MSAKVDDRFLDHWQDSQRKQRAMREYLTRSSLRPETFEPRTLDLIAEAFKPRSPERTGPSFAGTAALLSDDR